MAKNKGTIRFSERQKNVLAWFVIAFIITTPYLYAITVGKQKPTIQLISLIDCEVKNKYIEYKLSNADENINNLEANITSLQKKTEIQKRNIIYLLGVTNKSYICNAEQQYLYS